MNHEQMVQSLDEKDLSMLQDLILSSDDTFGSLRIASDRTFLHDNWSLCNCDHVKMEMC